ncbi:MAG TPA: TonB-dependent receptor, partial [Rhodanobacteraceae bacterium]|nr:TonB-dependent receptor [Rhodanobacteraceae bacterium]
MTCRKSLLSASILAGLSFASVLYAEDAPAPAATGPAGASQDSTSSSSEEMETIVVRGIRESLKRSLETKRDADAVVDAITAEDIGKFPSTNVAEAMAQIPGV